MVIRKRLNLTGPGLVFVTTTVTNWIPIFNDEKIAYVVASKLKESLEYFKISPVGYVIMPTHLHMLLGFRQIEKLSRFMQSFKILSAKSVKEIVPKRYIRSFTSGNGFRLWKTRFDDLIINTEQQSRIKLEYIHNNPVKAGLVEKASDWRFSSAADWLENRRGFLNIDKDFTWTD